MIRDVDNILNWDEYLFSKELEKGFYIKEEKPDKILYFGPFKSDKFAEFFNYLAYCSPRETNAEQTSKNSILELSKIDKNKKTLFLHPKYLCFESSNFGVWWHDIYGQELNQKMVLGVARECKANGYQSFRDWLLNGSKINNIPIHSQFVETYD